MSELFSNLSGTTKKKFRIGTNGATIHSLTSIPTSGLGVEGDWCLVTTPPSIFYRGQSAWIEYGTRDVVTVSSSQSFTPSVPVSCVVCTHSAELTITLGTMPPEGYQFTIKDASGDAATNNIIIDGNGETIDGQSQQTISSDYASMTLLSTASGYLIV